MKKNILAVLTIVVILGSVGLNFGYINSSNGSQVILLNHLSSKIYPNFKESSSDAPIFVDGNDDLTQFPGNGTEGNPYVIQNYVIHSMSGGPAIEIRNTDAFLIIKNCTVSGSITHMQGGIVLYSCKNVKITECTAKNNSVGIKLQYSHNNIVSHNNVSYNHWMGIYLAGSDNNIISENFGFKSGIFITIHWWSQKNEISGNNATDFGVGIQVAYSNNNTVLNNMVTNSPDRVGIAVAHSPSNIISGNDVSYTNIGIEVIFSDNNMFSGNTATHTINGILLIGSNNSIISGNYLIENEAGGIGLSNSINNNIFENDLLYNYQAGIGLFTSYNNTISKNNISLNLIYGGILLQNADFNIIQNNFITENKEYGIWLQSSRYNKILV
ncbi:MAG: nitrous oxide reductase family maturation protein NosD, partial [Candidatus Hodarchaeota archaeon]